MCAADSTLEELDEVDHLYPYEPKQGNTGYHNPHTSVCRNWMGLLEAARSHGILKSDDRWIPLEQNKWNNVMDRTVE
jgi:hypothetical protein